MMHSDCCVICEQSQNRSIIAEGSKYLRDKKAGFNK